MTTDADTEIPGWIRRWGDIAWRVAAIGVVVYFGFLAFARVEVIFIAGAVALLLASVLWVPTRWLMDHRWPPMLAAISVLAGALVVLGGILGLILPPLIASFEDIGTDVRELLEAGREWLTEGPLGLTDTNIDQLLERALEQFQQFGGDWLVSGASTAIEVVGGSFLVVIITFFLLKDARRMAAAFLVRRPAERARRWAAAFGVGWRTLARYMTSMTAVGLFDALVIGLGLLIVGVPLVLPLAVLVFFGAFIPILGAFISGLVAVAVAFVNGGPVDALIILGITVAVQQFEGDVVLPLVFGQTLKLHPLVILLGVTAGGLAFGLVGAFIAVPLVALFVTIHEALTEDAEASLVHLLRG